MLNIIKKIHSFWRWSLPFIKVFKPIQGIKIALKIRKSIWAGKPGSIIEVNIPSWKFPIYLRAGSSDGAVFDQVFLQRQGYFPSSSPKYIVDAGANIGLVSICCANRWPDSEIVAIEIEKNNYEMLIKNCSPYRNISTLHQGLWSHSTNLIIENPNGNSWAFRTKEVPTGTQHSIKAIGIKELIEQKGWPHIDILKMDIEGAEYDIFTNDITDWVEYTNCLIIEIHENLRPGVTDLVVNLLKEKGFTFYHWSEYWVFSKTINNSEVNNNLNQY